MEEDKTYTLTIRHAGKFDYAVTIPELGVTTQSTPTLDSALNLAGHLIEKHLTTRYLILVFGDQPEQPQSQLERQDISALEKLGIASQTERKERHLVFPLVQPLTREQARWLDAQSGQSFDRYYTKDEIEVALDEMREKAYKRQ